MKRLLSTMLVIIICLSVTGCSFNMSESGSSGSSDTNNSTTVSSVNTETPTESVKIKKSVEEWFGGKETGYVSHLTEYDENGKVIKITDYAKEPAGDIRQTQEYKREETSTGSTVTETVVDYLKNKTTTTVTNYNKDGKMTEEYEYDENGNCTFKQVLEYDSSGKKIRLTVDEKRITEYEYDEHDNLIKEVYNGSVQAEYQYKYDEKGNILEKSKKNDSSGNFELKETYEYASDGYLYKKIKHIKPGQTVTYTYNEKGILIDEYGCPDSPDTTVHKSYNENNGRLEKETASTNHTKTTNYEYNEEGDLIKESSYDNWDGGSTFSKDYVITYWN